MPEHAASGSVRVRISVSNCQFGASQRHTWEQADGHPTAFMSSFSVQ